MMNEEASYDKIKEEIMGQILEQLSYQKETEDEILQQMIDQIILSNSLIRLWSVPRKVQIKREIFYSIRKLDILQEFLDDPSITEIMIVGKDKIFIEKDGKISLLDKSFGSEEKLQDVIQQMVSECNRMVNESSPIVDARLPDGSRVHVVLPPVALDGPCVTIRRFPKNPITMEKLISYGSISEEAADFLQKLVRSGYNIFISGGTGSGKTTFLNALSGYIPKSERIITIEDSAELQIRGVKNLVRLETRNANVEGCKAITIRQLIKASLRMRPDRIIVGEVRGEEAIDMIQALNTGHDGSLSTGHANSSKEMLYRLETMILMGMDMPLTAIRKQIASGIDIIVHLGRLRDGTRKVLEITEVLGYEKEEIKTKPLYCFIEKDGGKGDFVVGGLEKMGDLEYVEKLKRSGEA